MAYHIQTDNSAAFSNSSNTDKYHRIGSRGPANTPRTSVRTRTIQKMSLPSTSYLRYSVPESTKKLDLMFAMPENSDVFPLNIYSKEPFAYSPSYLIIPRDPNLLYTYSPQASNGKERSHHPENASRFGYDLFPNEYGLGTQSRGYIEARECHSCAKDTPPNMAPKRFYDYYNLEQSPTEMRKYIHMEPPRVPTKF
jgi:hypothetical protein